MVHSRKQVWGQITSVEIIDFFEYSPPQEFRKFMQSLESGQPKPIPTHKQQVEGTSISNAIGHNRPSE
jgi:hypothetical protein